MKRIEIYYNSNDGLLAMQFEHGRAGRIFLSKKYNNDDDIRELLSELTSDDIKESYCNDNIYVDVVYDDFFIRLYNYDAIREASVLNNYLATIDEYIAKKDSMKSVAPKVKRKNKYVGKKIIATGLVLATLIGSAYVIGGIASKSDSSQEYDTITTKTTVATEYEQNKPQITASVVGVDLKEPVVTTTMYDTTTDIPSDTIPKTLDNVPTIEPEVTSDIVDDNEVIYDDSKEEFDDFVSDYEYVSIEYEDRSFEDKAIKAKELYADTITKYATAYGIDPALVMAVATQERGIHSSTTDRGGATGLMQIQNSIWLGNSITAYNFTTGKYDTVCVNLDVLANCETNIQVGCMILQAVMKENNYNIILGLQSYNMGTFGASKAVLAYANATGQTKQEVIDNPYDCGWLDYRNGIKGDSLYVEHVLSYIGEDINIYVYKIDGTKITCNVKTYENSKSR